MWDRLGQDSSGLTGLSAAQRCCESGPTLRPTRSFQAIKPHPIPVPYEARIYILRRVLPYPIASQGPHPDKARGRGTSHPRGTARDDARRQQTKPPEHDEILEMASPRIPLAWARAHEQEECIRFPHAHRPISCHTDSRQKPLFAFPDPADVCRGWTTCMAIFNCVHIYCPAHHSSTRRIICPKVGVTDLPTLSHPPHALHPLISTMWPIVY